MSDLQRKIISEIHRREEQIHFNLKDRKFKDKVDYLKGGLFELQDFREWLANVDDTNNETALNIDLVSHCDTCGKELTNIGGSQMYCYTCGTTKIGCC